MRASLPVLLCLFAAAPAGAAEIERTSEPVKPATEAREGWRSEGFRLELQFGWQLLHAAQDADRFGTPRGDGFSFGVEPGVRLSRAIGISAGLRYSVVPGDDHLRPDGIYESRSGGLSWGVTGNLTWYPVDPIFVAVGLGYGGMLTDCHATGGAALVRTGALLVVGESMAMGPTVQAGIASTGCSGRSYLHDSVVFAWAFAWR